MWFMKRLKIRAAAHYLKAHQLLLIYSAISLASILPLLAPGYILTLDLVFTPRLHLPGEITASYPLHVLFYLLNIVLPGDVVEKMMLLAILLLAGIGMHRLAADCNRGYSQAAWRASCYVAGGLYMINPFTYDRFMAGQYNVLLGYALLPWFISSLFSFLHQPGWKGALKLTAWTVVIGIVSVHTLGMLAVAAAVALAIWLWRRRNERVFVQRIATWAGCWIGLSILLSSYWLVPTLLGQGRIAQSVRNFDQTQRAAFATADVHGTGTLPAVLGLQGFWGELQGLYVLPHEAFGGWCLVQLLLWMIIAVGVAAAWRRDRRRALYFTILAVVAVVLALGTWNDWLAGWLPFFAGYREPQKFVALLAVAYGYFWLFGIAALTDKLTVAWLRWIPALAGCVLVVLYTQPMLWGFSGQLQPRQYPADWSAVNRLLDKDMPEGAALFLPWHLYMHFGFAGRIVANPAQYFFDKPVIVSDDPEFAGAKPEVPNPLKDTIGQQLLVRAASRQPVAAELEHLGIHYIVLAKELDWEQYDYLNSQPGIQVQAEYDTLKVYKVGR